MKFWVAKLARTRRVKEPRGPGRPGGGERGRGEVGEGSWKKGKAFFGPDLNYLEFYPENFVTNKFPSFLFRFGGKLLPYPFCLFGSFPQNPSRYPNRPFFGQKNSLIRDFLQFLLQGLPLENFTVFPVPPPPHTRHPSPPPTAWEEHAPSFPGGIFNLWRNLKIGAILNKMGHLRRGPVPEFEEQSGARGGRRFERDPHGFFPSRTHGPSPRENLSSPCVF